LRQCRLSFQDAAAGLQQGSNGLVWFGLVWFGLVWIIFYAIRATDQSNMPQKS